MLLLIEVSKKDREAIEEETSEVRKTIDEHSNTVIKCTTQRKKLNFFELYTTFSAMTILIIPLEGVEGPIY